MGRMSGYYLDKSPTSTVAVCRVCGARCAARTSAGARRLIVAHMPIHGALH